MDTGNLLQGIGLFVCVGAIVLIALVAFAARALARGRGADRQPTMWNTRGEERPQYDDRDVETRGGFGGVPATGRDDDSDPDPRNADPRSGGFGRSQGSFRPDSDRPLGSSRSSGFGADEPRRPSQGGSRGGGSRGGGSGSRADDDDIRSSGGFGGG